MSEMSILKVLLISEVIWIIGLFFAMKITGVSCGLWQFILIVFLPSLVVLAPVSFCIKYTIAVILMYALIVKLTNADFWPDAVFAVVVSNIIYVVSWVLVVPKIA